MTTKRGPQFDSMTVADLIEVLQELPPQAIVMLGTVDDMDDEEPTLHDILNIEDPVLFYEGNALDEIRDGGKASLPGWVRNCAEGQFVIICAGDDLFYLNADDVAEIRNSDDKRDLRPAMTDEQLLEAANNEDKP